MRRASITGGTVSTLNELNRSRVVQELYRRGVCSRADIARAVGLTPPSVTRIIGQLIDMGIVVEDGSYQGSGPHRSIGIKLNEHRCHVIGVRFSPGRAEGAVFSLSGGLGSKGGDDIDFGYGDELMATDVIERIQTWIGERVTADPSIAAIGIALPAPYDRSVSRGWLQADPRKAFADAFGLPVFSESDGRAGALAQMLLIPNRDAVNADGSDDPEPMVDSLAYFMLGGALALGVVDHGEFIRGAHGFAGSIDHMSIDVNGRACECRARGCLRQYCTTDGMARTIRESYPELAQTHEGAPARELCERLGESALAGDGRALGVVERIGTVIGYGCLAIDSAYDPELIVLSDLNGLPGELVLPVVRGVMEDRVVPGIAGRARIKLDDFSRDTILCGAAALAIERVLESPTQFVTVRG